MVKHTNKYQRDTTAIIIIALNLAKKTKVSVNTNKAYSNRENEEDKCCNSKPTTVANRVCAKM